MLVLAGLVLLVYVTCGAMALYAPILFSVHTAAHLLLSFPVPLLLIAGFALAVPPGWRDMELSAWLKAWNNARRSASVSPENNRSISAR